MKKAKIMFMSLGVIAVVGGALAFKAKNMSQGRLYICDLFAQTCVISHPESFFDFTAVNGFIFFNATLDNRDLSGQQCAGNCDYTVQLTVED